MVSCYFAYEFATVIKNSYPDLDQKLVKSSSSSTAADILAM